VSGTEKSRELKRALRTRKTLSRFKDNKRKPDQKTVTVPDKEVKKLKCWGEKDVQTNRRQQERLSRFKDAENSELCQDSDMSGASQFKRQWQHQTKMSKARNIKDKDFQEITQPTAVPARRSAAVPIGSPLSL